MTNLQGGYAVIDLEMAGANYRTGSIIEMAVGVLLPGRDLAMDRVLVKINQPLPKRIVGLTGITDRELAMQGIPIDDALAWFANSTADLPLVGHSVFQSDRLFLLEAARRHYQTVEAGLYPQLCISEEQDLPAHRFIDTAGLYKGYKLGEYKRTEESHEQYVQRMLNLPAKGLRISMSAACEDLGVATPRIRAHRALGDVVQNQKLFEKLLEVNPPE